MKKTTILIDMYGVILEESKGFFIPYTFNAFDQSEYDRLTRQFREENLFTKASNGELTSDEFLTRLGFDDPRFHMVNYIDHCLTLDKGFLPCTILCCFPMMFRSGAHISPSTTDWTDSSVTRSSAGM